MRTRTWRRQAAGQPDTIVVRRYSEYKPRMDRWVYAGLTPKERISIRHQYRRMRRAGLDRQLASHMICNLLCLGAIAKSQAIVKAA